jgi:hypothetical protein
MPCSQSCGRKDSELTVRNTARLPRVTATGCPSVPRLNRITGGPFNPVDPPVMPAKRTDAKP